ncbi:PEP-CTERM system TPR-repeat protein PrsT [Kordiimonas sp. SCSIO 12603]|uniref:XrtA/PEP-CTERM system TPR-repeat protein PrsT n=1 Tax=Kordiimonas sp. SCSIO 12603 TaxID=2829596 RepID=UPI002101EDFC|nr:XrtA/PEP-CTERM system TPR-repeat protein PrsT [Kordiimonas sp. SCSIO 12603]UTW57590.1 PEP-CTERM system TPR-repeat protein PrsT [Kordiimonas sp. SCSIO 12603]
MPKNRTAFSRTKGLMLALMLSSSSLAIAQSDVFSEARAAISSRDYEQAITILNDIDAAGEIAVQKYLLLADVYLRSGAGIPAEAAVDRARRFGADYAATSVPYAKSLLLQSKYNEALEALRGVTIPQAFLADAFIVSGDASFALRRYSNAETDYQQARELSDAAFEPYLGLSRLELRKDNLEGASKLVEEAFKRAPENTMVQFTRGLIAKYQGNLELAEQRFRESVELFSGNLMSNLELASLMIGKGDIPAAEEYLDSVYAASPRQPMAIYLSGVISAQKKQFEDADAYLNRSRQIVENYLPAMYVRGLVSYQLERFAEAARYLKRVYEVRPGNTTTRVALAGAYMKIGQSRAALDILEPMLATEGGKKDVSLWSMAATAAASSGDLELSKKYLSIIADLGEEASGNIVSNFDARIALATYVEGAPEEALASFSNVVAGREAELRELGVLGSMQLKNKDYDGAKSTVDRILSTAPNRALGYNIQGTLLYRLGQFSDAVNSYTNAIDRNSEYFAAYRNRALAHYRLQQYAEAERDLKRLLEFQPNDSRSKAVLGRTLLAQGEAREAVDYFREAIRAYPRSAQLSADYAQALSEAGITTKAIEQARFTSVLAEEKPELLKRMGMLLLDLGQPRAAERPLSRHAAFNFTSGEAHLLHGRAMLQVGLYTGARMSFERAETAQNNKPDHDVVNWYIFASLAEGQQFSEAKKMLPVLVEGKRPEDVLAGIVGKLLFTSGEVVAAEKAYRDVLQKFPADDVIIGLANALKEQGRQEEAVVELRSYVTANPDSRIVRSLLGHYYEEIGDDESAGHQYEIILNTGLVDAEIAARLAMVYLRRGNKLSSRLAERAYLVLPDDPYILDVYGWVLLQADRDTKKAIDALSKAVRKAPSNALYKYHLGMAYLAQGSRSNARRYLTQAINLDDSFSGAEEAKRQIQLLEY